MFIELSIHPHRPVFQSPADRLAFARRAAGESPNHHLELVAWRLVENDAVLLLRGRERDALRFAGLLLAHHVRAVGIAGTRSTRHASVLPTTSRAWDRITALHAARPLDDPWTSLWDGLGLRAAPWFQAHTLRTVAGPALLEATSWSGPEPGHPQPGVARPEPELVEAAVALTCGLPRAACPSHLLELAVAVSTEQPAALDTSALPPAVWRALAVLADPRLHPAARRTP